MLQLETINHPPPLSFNMELKPAPNIDSHPSLTMSDSEPLDIETYVPTDSDSNDTQIKVDLHNIKLENLSEDSMSDFDSHLTSQILASFRSKLLSGAGGFGNLGLDNVPGMTGNFAGLNSVEGQIKNDWTSNSIYQESHYCPKPDSVGSGSYLSQSYSSPQLSPSSTTSSTNQNASCNEDLQTSPDSTFHTEAADSYSGSFTDISYPSLPHSLSSQSDFSQSEADQAAPTKQKCPIRSSHILPPCRVCGDRASGFHYGANTCEACKGFFRRSLKKNFVEYKCNASNNCIIQKGRRNNCPLCRYNKCLAIGMSKQDTNTIDYIWDVVCKAVMERSPLNVRQLEQFVLYELGPCEESAYLHGLCTFYAKPLTKANKAIKTGRYTHEKRTKDIVEVKQLSGDLTPHVTPSSGSLNMHTSLATPANPPVLSVENKEILHKIYSAHKVLFPLWHKTLNSGMLPTLMKQFAEKCQAKTSMFGTDKIISKEEYSEFYKSTGVDVDDRADTIEALTQHLELAIMTFVRFAKSVPGFTELPLNDQATLVKLSRFEIWMIGAHPFLNKELEVIVGPRGKTYHLDDLARVLDGGFVRSMFSFAKTLQLINLTHEETAILKCVALMFADRSELQQPGAVEAIQLRLISCLESLLNSGKRFSQVMNALVKLRDLTEWHKQISENLILEWPTIKHNPLLLEIMSV